MSNRPPPSTQGKASPEGELLPHPRKSLTQPSIRSYPHQLLPPPPPLSHIKAAAKSHMQISCPGTATRVSGAPPHSTPAWTLPMSWGLGKEGGLSEGSHSPVLSHFTLTATLTELAQFYEKAEVLKWGIHLSKITKPGGPRGRIRTQLPRTPGQALFQTQICPASRCQLNTCNPNHSGPQITWETGKS